MGDVQMNEQVGGGTAGGSVENAGSGVVASERLSSMAEEISGALFAKSGEEESAGEGESQDSGQAAAEAEAKAKAAEAAAAAAQQKQAAAPAAKPGPKTWRAEALAEWDKLPPKVQEEVLKREEDIFKGLETYKAKASIGDAVQQVVAPYMEIISKAGLQPLPLIQNLLQAHTVLATGSDEQRYQLFQALASEYGIDLSKKPAQADPVVSSLQKEVAELKSKLSDKERREVESDRTRLQAELDAFASDPANPYFDEVANDIAALLKSGVAKDLKDAYDRAVWANPVTRAKEQARQTAEAQAKAQAESAKKAEEVRKATSANVKSKAKVASATTPLGSIDDTLMETMAAIKGRV